MSEGALEGIRVIELGQQVSAPYCARLFADYGAQVIKVEPPAGDGYRHLASLAGMPQAPEPFHMQYSFTTVHNSLSTAQGKILVRSSVSSTIFSALTIEDQNKCV